MSVTVRTKRADGISVIELAGRVTLGEATGKVRDAVRDVVSKGERKVVLNLSGVTYMDSAGLGEVIGAYTTMKNQGGEMKLVGASGRALDLLQVTKLITLFEFYDDEPAAFRSFAKSA
jgi:anti-sigma B factor antagonist